MTEPLIERPRLSEISERFRKMADRIDHNSDAKFGGACVIIPPADGGAPIEILVLDEAANIAQFWSAIQTRSAMVMEELKVTQDRLRGFR